MKRISRGGKTEVRSEATFLWFCDKQDEARLLHPEVLPWLGISESEERQGWERVRERVLAYFKQNHPGHRPSTWWKYDAPRATPGTYRNKLGLDLDPDCKLPEPRRKLSGKGRPAWEVIALAPNLEFGLPQDWTVAEDSEGAVKDFLLSGSVDTSDPPHFESEAAYLRRHALLTSEEANRSNFSHAILEGDEPCKPGCQCGRHGDKIGTRGKW